MKESCCQESVDSILRRLQGRDVPHTSQQPQPTVPIVVPVASVEIEELKDVIRAIGAKLQNTRQELVETKAAVHSREQENQRLADALQRLQSSFNAKDQELSRALSAVHATVPNKEASLVWEGERQELLSQLQILTQEKEVFSKKERAFAAERSALEAALEQERQKKRFDSLPNNGQFVRLSMTCKQLEEEVHSLQCERTALNRHLQQQKVQLEEAQRVLASERLRVSTIESETAAAVRSAEERLKTIEAQAAAIHTLTVEKEALLTRENSYLATLSDLNLSIAKERMHTESLSGSLKASEEAKEVLFQHLEQEKRQAREAIDRSAMDRREKEASDARVKEVEELLITKLQAIADLEEQLGEALATSEDFEHQLNGAQQTISSLHDELAATKQSKEELHEKVLSLEQQIARLSTENAELRKRTESFERLKKSVMEASSHAQAILRTLGHSPKSAPAFDSVASAFEPITFEEQYEQHELF